METSRWEDLTNCPCRSCSFCWPVLMQQCCGWKGAGPGLSKQRYSQAIVLHGLPDPGSSWTTPLSSNLFLQWKTSGSCRSALWSVVEYLAFCEKPSKWLGEGLVCWRLSKHAWWCVDDNKYHSWSSDLSLAQSLKKRPDFCLSKIWLFSPN